MSSGSFIRNRSDKTDKLTLSELDELIAKAEATYVVPSSPDNSSILERLEFLNHAVYVLTHLTTTVDLPHFATPSMFTPQVWMEWDNSLCRINAKREILLNWLKNETPKQ